MHIIIFQIFFVVLLSLNSLIAQNSTLTLNILNVQDNTGKIHVAIFRQEDNFPFEGGAWKEYNTQAVENITTYELKDLPKGEYAIAIFHDENQSGKCETNMIGFPKEGYCFSKNFKVFLSAPSFSKCSFVLQEDKTLDINMRY